MSRAKHDHEWREISRTLEPPFRVLLVCVFCPQTKVEKMVETLAA